MASSGSIGLISLILTAVDVCAGGFLSVSAPESVVLSFDSDLGPEVFISLMIAFIVAERFGRVLNYGQELGPWLCDVLV